MNINEIATQAAKLGVNVKKEMVFEILKDVISSQRTFMTDDELIKLYKYFLPDPPKRKLSVFQWVNQAVSKDAVRPYLHFVYVSGGVMVATDGHRLHLAPTDLENGFYDKAMNKLDLNLTFPDYKRIIPQDGKCYKWVRKEAQLSPRGTEEILHTYILPSGQHVNKKYFDQATHGLDDFEYLACPHDYDPIKATLEDGRVFVLMGMKV